MNVTIRPKFYVLVTFSLYGPNVWWNWKLTGRWKLVNGCVQVEVELFRETDVFCWKRFRYTMEHISFRTFLREDDWHIREESDIFTCEK